MDKNRYNTSKIYKIIDGDDYFYIGSTTTTLTKRLSWHKSTAREWPERKAYKHFASICWDVKIILMEEHYLENHEQLLREEDKVIRMYKDDPKCLNTCKRAVLRAGETQEYQQKYREDHREELRQRAREYTKEKREQIRARKQIIYTCQCGASDILYDHRSRHERSRRHQVWLHDDKADAATI